MMFLWSLSFLLSLFVYFYVVFPFLFSLPTKIILSFSLLSLDGVNEVVAHGREVVLLWMVGCLYFLVPLNVSRIIVVEERL